MGYKDETYTCELINWENLDKKVLQQKLIHYLPNGEKKMHCDKLCDFYPFEIVKNSMINFFKDEEVLAFLIASKKTEKIEFTSSYEKDKYYDIHFIYHYEDGKIKQVNMVIDSERQVGTLEL